jgi:signal transduction histidine kinase
LTKRRDLSETGLSRVLDRGRLGVLQRFQSRLLGYLIALSFASSVVAGGIYYSRQVKFVEAEQRKRGRTLISNLAGQSELGAYSGDSAFLFGPAQRAFQESDVSFAVIYSRKGAPLIKLSKPGVDLETQLPVRLLQRLLDAPSARPVVLHRGEYDDLLFPIASTRDDAEEGLFGTQADRTPSVTIGIARLGLSRMPARKKLDEVLRWGIYLALIVLAMGALLALILSRRISRPILALARGADEVRRGNLGFQLELERTDELGLLAESFNRMSAKLHETVESLAHLNRHLEQKVADRTADLRRSRDFVALLNAPLQLEKLLDRALRAMMSQTDALAGAIFLSRAKGGLELVVSQGALAGAFLDEDGSTPSCLHEACRRGEPQVVEGLPEGSPLARECPEGRVLLCMPILFQQRLEAALLLALKQAPEPDLVDFVGHASSELAIAVANARALVAAERLARELERRNIALMQQRDQLLEVSRLKSEFLANISHELRTPLNAILGYAELMSDGVYGAVNPEQVQSLAGVNESASSLLTLIDQILDLSKVEAGRMKVRMKEVDLNHLVREVVGMSAALTNNRPYDVTEQRPEGPLRVRTDPTMVRQILVNLVSNAIKFTKEGSVELVAQETDTDDVLVAVRDTGIGIRPEHLEVIFDEFRQVDGSSTRQHGGTGLGLAISKKFASLLGGDIQVQSTPGKGSSFTLVLYKARIHTVTGEHPLAEVPVTIGESDAR